MKSESMIEEKPEESSASVLAEKLLNLLWLAQDLVEEECLPASLRHRVEKIAFGVSRVFGEPLPFEDGCCPRCGGATFTAAVRVDSWGTCLENPLDGGPLYCEGCGQKLQMAEACGQGPSTSRARLAIVKPAQSR